MQGAGRDSRCSRLFCDPPEQAFRLAGDDVLCVGEGPVTVVALHGIQGTRAAWLPLARQLADRCTFILPNLPGRGTAAPPRDARDCSLDAYAAAVARVIETHVVARAQGSADRPTGTGARDGTRDDTLDGTRPGTPSGTRTATPFVLAGWSMGVSVVLAYLRHAHAQAHAGAGTGAPPMPAALLLVSGTPCLREVAWFASPGDAASSAPPSTEPPSTLLGEIAARERRLGLAEAAGHRAVAWTWMAIHRTDQRAELAAVTCPTLVVHGSEDSDCPLAHGTMLADGIAGAELLVLQGAGHGVLTERTADIAAHLRERWPAC